MADLNNIIEELSWIDKKRLELDGERISLLVKKAKLEGAIVDSAGALKCPLGHASGFVETEDSLEWEKVKSFACEECKKKGIMSNVAYRCPICGIVVGKMSERRYDDIGFLSGSSGVEFTCTVCGRSMGRKVYVQS